MILQPITLNFRAKFTQRRGFFTHSAFTLPELLVLAATVFILVVVFSPAFTHSKVKRGKIKCVNNLKEIGLAHRIFAADNGDHFPWGKNKHKLRDLTPDEQLLLCFRTLSNELFIPKVLACWADTRKPATNWTGLTTNNISYFFSMDEAHPQSFLAGDRNLTVNGQPVSGRVTISSNALVAWDKTIHNLQGNTAMGDGSVQQLSAARLRNQIPNTGLPTNTFLIP